MSEASRRTLVIGIGNPMRGDDAAGLEVVRRLPAAQMEGVEIRELDGETSDLIMAWEGFDDIVVVDAGKRGADPGTLHRFPIYYNESLPAELGATSTHALGLTQAVELARALGRLPPRLVLMIIEGKSFALGDPLSPEVATAIDAAVDTVLVELSRFARSDASAMEDESYA